MTTPPLIPQPPLVQIPPTPLIAPRSVDLITAVLSATTGIPPHLVRPRWQPTPPQQPPAGTLWAAVGITRRLAEGYSWQGMTTLPGTTTEALLLQRWETVEALCSFYGPNSEDAAELFRDSLYLGQNLEALIVNGFAVTGFGEVLAVPDLTNWQWIDHQDVRFELARQFNRFYPMQSLTSTQGTIVTDVTAVGPIPTTPPFGPPLTISYGGPPGPPGPPGPQGPVSSPVAVGPTIGWEAATAIYAGTFTFTEYASLGGTINSLRATVGSGGGVVAATVSINGIPVGGLNSVVVNSASVQSFFATAPNIYNAGDKLTLTLTITSGTPAGSVFTLLVS